MIKCGRMENGMKRIVSLILCFSIVLGSAIMSVSGLSKMGSRSREVERVQSALKNRGYYTYTVDGIFGTRTRSAVINFQRDHGLSPDGIAGEKTLKALGVTETDSGYGGFSSSDYDLLARIISAEARGESYLGQVAVGAVVLNRIEHPSFPDSLSGVIYQNGAFSCLMDGQFYEPIADSAYSAARDAINGLDPSGGAIYYYNPAIATSKWIFSRPIITTIGNHRFCS